MYKKYRIELNLRKTARAAVFEALGYTGVTGIGWGILAGFIVSVAIELGYDVREMGGRYILFKKKGAKV